MRQVALIGFLSDIHVNQLRSVLVKLVCSLETCAFSSPLKLDSLRLPFSPISCACLWQSAKIVYMYVASIKQIHSNEHCWYAFNRQFICAHWQKKPRWKLSNSSECFEMAFDEQNSSSLQFLFFLFARRTSKQSPFERSVSLICTSQKFPLAQ